MDLKNYRAKLVGNDDERAVSPVIGVILMVAITVILAAVIAAFVLDIGDLDDSSPNAQFDWNTTDEGIASVSHTSGDDIDLSNIEIDVDYSGSEETLPQNEDDVDIAGESDIEFDDGAFDGDEWTAGDSLVFDDDGDNDAFPDEVTVIWVADGSSTVITENEA